MINIKRGEIYMANLPKAGGSIQHGYRPVVIVQNKCCLETILLLD